MKFAKLCPPITENTQKQRTKHHFVLKTNNIYFIIINMNCDMLNTYNNIERLLKGKMVYLFKPSFQIQFR